MNRRSKPKEYKNHTSVSLKLKHVEKLTAAANDIGISTNDLMILLLRYVNERSFAIVGKRPRIKYQMPEGDIQIVNLYIDQRDYERNLDARRYGKVSVSWLLAYAVDHFLNIVIRKILKSFIDGTEILNNYLGAQVFLVKKLTNRVKMVSIWYPKKE